MSKAKPNAKAPVGQGGRFAALTQKLEGQGKSPESAQKIAAFVGREKYGNSRMQRMATAGRKKK
jgi:hypothetical protein